jgi:hypothetical protein
VDTFATGETLMVNTGEHEQMSRPSTPVLLATRASAVPPVEVRASLPGAARASLSGRASLPSPEPPPPADLPVPLAPEAAPPPAVHTLLEQRAVRRPGKGGIIAGAALAFVGIAAIAFVTTRGLSGDPDPGATGRGVAPLPAQGHLVPRVPPALPADPSAVVAPPPAPAVAGTPAVAPALPPPTEPVAAGPPVRDGRRDPRGRNVPAAPVPQVSAPVVAPPPAVQLPPPVQPQVQAPPPPPVQPQVQAPPPPPVQPDPPRVREEPRTPREPQPTKRGPGIAREW